MTVAIDWPRPERFGGAAAVLALAVLTAWTAAASGPTVLVRDGAAVATIYVSPAREQPPQRRGRPKLPGPLEAVVEDFNYHVEKMTGVRLPVVPVTTVTEVRRPGCEKDRTVNGTFASVRMAMTDGSVRGWSHVPGASALQSPATASERPRSGRFFAIGAGRC